MRKKLERSKLKIDCIQNVLNNQCELGRSKNDNGPSASDTDSEPFFNQLIEGGKRMMLMGSYIMNIPIKKQMMGRMWPP